VSLRPVPALLLLLGLVFVLVPPGSADAHQGAPLGVVRVAQSLGDRDLTVTLFLPAGGAGAVPVTLEALGPPTARPVRVALVPSGEGSVSESSLVPGPVGSPGRATGRVDAEGTWDVVLEDGAARARFPVTYLDPGTPAWQWALRGGAAVAVVAGIALSGRSARRRPLRAGALGVLLGAGVAVAATAAVLGTDPSPAGWAPGDPAVVTAATVTPTGTEMAGMDMAGMDDAGHESGMGEGAVVVTPALDGAPGPYGVGSVLTLALTDSTTGRPVDDLLVHDEAFIHLAVLGADGSESHLHPVRTAPGRWEVRFTPSGPGGYGLFAEIARPGTGHEVLRTAVDVAGARPTPVAVAGPGPRRVGDTDVLVTASGFRAGAPATVRLELSEGGRPVEDLQTWLGMAGHLFVLGPGAAGRPDPLDPAASFSHVHDMQAALPGRGLGPGIAFTYSFPAAGTYRMWAQVLQRGTVLTVPIEVAVAPG
jgi:hypothetical protein